MASPRQVKKFKRFVAQKLNMEMRDKLKEIIKPKPKFMPWFVWKYLMRLLLNLEEN